VLAALRRIRGFFVSDFSGEARFEAHEDAKVPWWQAGAKRSTAGCPPASSRLHIAGARRSGDVWSAERACQLVDYVMRRSQPPRADPTFMSAPDKAGSRGHDNRQRKRHHTFGQRN